MLDRCKGRENAAFRDARHRARYIPAVKISVKSRISHFQPSHYEDVKRYKQNYNAGTKQILYQSEIDSGAESV